MRCCRLLASCLLVISLLVVPSVAPADVVTEWNEVLRQAMQADAMASNPGWSSRTMAMMNGAAYDSMQAIQRTHQPLLVDTRAAADTPPAVAIAQASHRILSLAYPNQRPMFDAALSHTLSGIADGDAKTAGVSLGNAVAEQYIDWRAGDGADVLVRYSPSHLPGHWRPDPMNPTQEAWGPGWGSVKPFTLTRDNQFPVPAPPDLSSQAYAAAFQEVKVLGELNSLTRTPEQTEIAYFWAYDRQGMGPPPVLYNRAVSQIAEQQGNTPQENARLFAITSVAMADAAVATWESKFEYDFWRPVTAIREADTDGNPDTDADPDWVPLGAPGAGNVPDFTPPFPAYVSGHATFGAATFRSLSHFYGTDDVSFTLTSDEMPGIVRQFESFSAAAAENARSRIYMGIHWNFDDIEGRALGNQIADWINANNFTVVPQIIGDFNGDGTLSIDDLNRLSMEISAGTLDAQFDLDQSGLVDLQDRLHWVTELKQTWIGDANLDGKFESGDLIEVLVAGRYGLDLDAGWAEGDWTGDQRFDSRDLIAAFNDGGYEQGVRFEVRSVPEPARSGLVAVWFVVWMMCRYSRYRNL